jgi:amidophosphoribosyltransferase
MPGQQQRFVEIGINPHFAHSSSRKKNVRRKLNAMALEFAGKNVLLVDGMLCSFLRGAWLTDPCSDSIVRGTTSKEIVQMAKDVGAKKIVVASCAPPIRCVSVLAHDRIYSRAGQLC